MPTSTESKPVIDFDALLRDVPGEDPAGSDLRADADAKRSLAELRGAVRSSDRIEEQLRTDLDATAPEEKDGQRQLPEWDRVLKESGDILSARSKDLQVAALLAHALVRKHHVAGMRDGLRLLERLLARYGSALHPREPAARAEILIRTCGEASPILLRPFEQATLFVGSMDGGQFTVALRDWRLAEDPRFVADRQRLERKVATREWLAVQLAELPAEVLAPLRADLAAVASALVDLERAAENVGVAFTASGLREAATDAVRRVGAPEGEAAEGLVRGAGGEGAGASSPSSSMALAAGRASSAGDAVRDRDQALAAVLQIAAWFERHEPQSTVALDLRKAVKRGRMPMDKVLADLLRPAAETAIDRALRDLGVEPPASSTSGTET